MNIRTIHGNRICLLGRAFSQVVLNICVTCSTNSDVASVIRNFLACIKDDSKGSSLPYCIFCLEVMMGEKRILVYLKSNKQTLSTKIFRECSFPAELTALPKLLNPYSKFSGALNLWLH